MQWNDEVWLMLHPSTDRLGGRNCDVDLDTHTVTDNEYGPLIE